MNIKRLMHHALAVCCCACICLAGCSGASPTPSAASSPSEIPSLSTADSIPATSAHVTTFAGSLMPGYVDGPLAQAQFIKPFGLCVGPDGEVLVVDCYANLLRSCNDAETTTRVGAVELLDRSGYPLGGYLDGPATESLLNRPRFAAVSQQGAIVFSDTGNHRLRVAYQGTVSLLAGDGVAGYQDGNYKTARFNTPSGVAIGSDGTVYVADTLNNCIRLIAPDGNVSTFAGSADRAGYRDGPVAQALFCEPNDLEIGSDGALYITDKGNQRIRKIYQGVVSTVAGSGKETDSATGYIIGGYQDGDTTQAIFQYPTGLHVAGDVIYVADTGNHCIRAIANGQVSTVTGTRMAGNTDGTAAEARFNQPLDVLLLDKTLYISDSYNHVIRVVQWENSSAGQKEK